MSKTITCRACRGLVELSPDLAGQLCDCPHCGTNFTAPTSLAVFSYPADLQDSSLPTARPVNIQVNVPPRQARHRDSGAVWFLKWMLAPAAVLFGLCGGIWVLFGVHSFFDVGGIKHEKATVEELHREVIHQASEALKLQGVNSVSKETAVDDLGGGSFVVVGRGKQGPILISFAVEIVRAEFDRTIEWKVRNITLTKE